MLDQPQKRTRTCTPAPKTISRRHPEPQDHSPAQVWATFRPDRGPRPPTEAPTKARDHPEGPRAAPRAAQDRQHGIQSAPRATQERSTAPQGLPRAAPEPKSNTRETQAKVLKLACLLLLVTGGPRAAKSTPGRAKESPRSGREKNELEMAIGRPHPSWHMGTRYNVAAALGIMLISALAGPVMCC